MAMNFGTNNAVGGVLMHIARTGSTWCNLEDLKAAMKQLGLSMEGTDDLIRNGQLHYFRHYNDVDMFTTPKYFKAETRLAFNMIRVRNAEPAHPAPADSALKELILKEAEKMGRSLAEEQEEAVIMAASSQLLVLTGGPGTGKTFTLNMIDAVLRAIGYRDIVYTAPTGKAARRISESTGKPAMTLHKKLGITKDNMEPKKLDCEVIIVDEVSMLDTEVADAFFEAVRSGTKVILVGDTDQLPSVGPGAVLRDMIESEVIPVARLLKTFRQGAESLIISNMKNIRDGIPNIRTGDDFMVATPNEAYSAVDEILMIYQSEYKRLGGNDDLVVLTPFRQKKYETSSEALNEKLQAMVNGSSQGILTKRGIWFRMGDPVMQTENRAECANGDVGRVIAVGENGITVKYIDCDVKYSKEELETGELVLAYAMSIHKSQGSEYKTVITTVLNEHGPMLQRNLLYTAVTRAKQKCFLVCEPDAATKAIRTQADINRTTLLVEMLRYYVAKSKLPKI